jgi:GT2 family glycosyltransferase
MEKTSINISIVIPAYNAAITIAETLRSVQAQTIAQWEVIIIDDGSSDQTVVIANQFVLQDQRIRLLSQPNQGVSVARNRGIALAKFDWLLLLDADDWIAPQYIEKMTAAIESDANLDAVHCGGSRIAPDGSTLFVQYAPPLPDLFPVFAAGCSLMIHACVVRKAIVQSVGGFDPSFHTSEDWDLWQRIARTGAKFGAIQEVMAFYRQRPNSLSRNTNYIFADTLRVVTQGHAPDPRVSTPHPLHAQGLTSDGLATLKLKIVPWFAGFCVTCGEDPLPLLNLLPNERDPSLSPRLTAYTIFKSISVSTCQPPAIWQQLWATIERPIQAFLEGLEAKSQTVGLAHSTRTILERMIIEASLSQLGDEPFALPRIGVMANDHLIL